MDDDGLMDRGPRGQIRQRPDLAKGLTAVASPGRERRDDASQSKNSRTTRPIDQRQSEKSHGSDELWPGARAPAHPPGRAHRPRPSALPAPAGPASPALIVGLNKRAVWLGLRSGPGGLSLLAGRWRYLFGLGLRETGQGFPELHIQVEGPFRFRGFAHAVRTFQGIGPSIWPSSALTRCPLSISRRFKRKVISLR